MVLQLDSAHQYRALMMILKSHRTLCVYMMLSQVLLRPTRSRLPCFLAILIFLSFNSENIFVKYYLIPSIDISSSLYQNLHYINMTPLSSQ